MAEAGDVAAETSEDLERAIDLVLYGIVRPLRSLCELMCPLEVHGQLCSMEPIPRSADPPNLSAAI